MKSMLFILLFITTQIVSANERLTSPQDRESREIQMAESAVLLSIMIPTNEEGRLYLDNTASAGELGLALIAAKNSKASLNSLAKLLRYRLDGSLAEDYHCFIPKKGKRVIKYLKQINPTKLETQCLGEVNKLLTLHPSLLSGQSIIKCTPEVEIKRQVKELIGSLDIQCNSEDF
ncbi:Imm57 family immunity protein [Aquirhabdus parva]|uniref:Uncharacterized protein n=1 Tax=Aquirhabdus parva TaxID=2283318 RepID=A0A345P6Y7_9GAMM|nr:Imm57 family immunity protein [Aquirhabdus parva]AXI03046.1 hypothetical protein HYN46_09470 [Aquirhabdus parva]